MYCRDWNIKNLLLKCVHSYFNIVVQLQTLMINFCGLEFWLFSVDLHKAQDSLNSYTLTEVNLQTVFFAGLYKA